jgi:chorismate synthase
MALLLDPGDPAVATVAASAREILVGLGAAPFVARLDAALASALAPTPTSVERADAPT